MVLKRAKCRTTPPHPAGPDEGSERTGGRPRRVRCRPRSASVRHEMRRPGRVGEEATQDGLGPARRADLGWGQQHSAAPSPRRSPART